MGVLTFALTALVAVAGTVSPLVTAPHGMHHLSRDPAFQAQFQRMERATLRTEYRGTVHVRDASITLARSIVFAAGVVQTDLGLAAEDYGKAVMQFRARHPGTKVLAAKSVALCNGQRGWLNSYAYAKSDTIVEEMYAAGEHSMYVAALMRPLSAPDPFQSERALYTLCPPDPWSRANPSHIQVADPIVEKGLWLHLGTAKPLSESLNLAQAPALSADDTPGDRIQRIVAAMQQQDGAMHFESSTAQKICHGTQDGWLVKYSRTYMQRSLEIESMYVFGADASFILSYSRSNGAPENPHARAALESLCAEGSASS